MKKPLLLSIVCLLVLPIAAKTNVPSIKPLPTSVYEGLPFFMKKLEDIRFPKRIFRLSEFGGIGNGQHDNSHAFAKAIDSLSSVGGGHLIVSEGIWMTGPIVLRDNVDLHLEQGAVIRFLGDKSLYPVVEVNFEGLKTYRCQSPITGKNLKNIAITGKGVIDGNGGVWRPVKKNKIAPQQWKALIKGGGVVDDDQWFPSEQYLRGKKQTENFNVPNFQDKKEFEEIKDFLRPVMVNLIACENVVLDGVTFQNSPAWCLHPLLCKNLRVSDIMVRNPWYSQNGDGIDIDACNGVVVYNSTFDVGDDAICLKSGKDKDGRRQGVKCENVIVNQCIVYHGHGGFVVGSEMSGGVRNIYVTNCTFLGTDAGLRFKSCRGRGGVVENVFINHIRMIDIMADPIIFNLYYQGKGAENALDGNNQPIIPAVDETTPVFKNVYISNVTCNGAKRTLYFNGLPEKPIENVVLQNLHMNAKKGAELYRVRGLEMLNCELNAEKGELLRLKDVKDATFTAVHSAYPEKDVITESQCDSLHYRGMVAKREKK